MYLLCVDMSFDILFGPPASCFLYFLRFFSPIVSKYAGAIFAKFAGFLDLRQRPISLKLVFDPSWDVAVATVFVGFIKNLWSEYFDMKPHRSYTHGLINRIRQVAPVCTPI